MAKCPNCNKEIGAHEFKIDRELRGIVPFAVFSCPHCQKILGVGIP